MSMAASPQREPLSEEIGRAPVNVYGATKALGEDLARLEHDDVIVARVASLFGVAGASGKGGNFVETMLRLGQERGRLTVVDDQIMSPTASWDAGEAILDLIAAEALPRRLPCRQFGRRQLAGVRRADHRARWRRRRGGADPDQRFSPRPRGVRPTARSPTSS